MAEKTYYVLCADDCKHEGMTKEQIVAAIAEATGSTPTGVDDAFITKIKEQNANAAMKIWVGTRAQYNALTEKDADTLYFIPAEMNEPVTNIAGDFTVGGTLTASKVVGAVYA